MLSVCIMPLACITAAAQLLPPPRPRPQSHRHGGEAAPPGTPADRPPPSASATARLEAALVHKVTALLGAAAGRDGCGEDHDASAGERTDAAETLVATLAEAAADGVDVARCVCSRHV